MKISQEEQLISRRKLITAAVEMITEKGFKGATMRAIARRAGVSDATIYNYFPNKEKLLAAYFEEGQLDTIDTLRSIENFHTYSLQEQLQTLIESKLEQFLSDREFVAIAFERAFQTPVASSSDMADGRALFTTCVKDMIDAAIEAGEIPDQPYQGMIPELITDLYLGIVYYWLKDDSEGFTRTTQLLDKSLDFLVSLLNSGVVAKAMDIAAFLFRQHIARYLDIMAPDLRKKPADKRHFMASHDE